MPFGIDTDRTIDWTLPGTEAVFVLRFLLPREGRKVRALIAEAFAAAEAAGNADAATPKLLEAIAVGLARSPIEGDLADVLYPEQLAALATAVWSEPRARAADFFNSASPRPSSAAAPAVATGGAAAPAASATPPQPPASLPAATAGAGAAATVTPAM